MIKMKHKKRTWKLSNGAKREAVEKARERVFKVAKRRGSITNQQARVIGKWAQAWYHLNAMRRAGLLKKSGFNNWVPRK